MICVDSAPELDHGDVSFPFRPTILVVDDDQSQVDVLRYRLGQQGFSTLSAPKGSDGIQLARIEQPVLILLDLCLPDTDGLTVCQQMSDDPLTGEIPVIIVSGVEQADLIRQCRAAGCRFYVRKPYDPNALLVLIYQTLEGEWS